MLHNEWNFVFVMTEDFFQFLNYSVQLHIL